MERHLGAFEHFFWLYDQVQPVHFSLCAHLRGHFSIAQLRQSLVRLQQKHPLLRVRIEPDEMGRPRFVEQAVPLPLRIATRHDEQQWQREVETELSQSFDWATAPLARVVLLQTATGTETHSELIVTCHHAIADGMSVAYLMRDIVQGLGSEPEQVRALSDAPTLEQLTVPMAPVDSPEPFSSKQPAYNSTVSTRPRPHFRTTWLPARLTQQLRDRSRAEHTSVHGVVSAAFLLSLARQRGDQASSLKCLSPINVRSHLSPSVSEALGLYIAYGLTHHDLSLGESIWDMARSLKAQLSEAAKPSQWMTDLSGRQTVAATCPDPHTVGQGMQQQYGFDLLVTNLGQLNLAQPSGPVGIESLYGPAVMTGLTQERVVGVATWGDRLSLSVLVPAADDSDWSAAALLTEAVEGLQWAVQVPSLSAA
ncbi:MAG: condensation domain-containing protein [Thermosynechococcaceae cyanobacterium]